MKLSVGCVLLASGTAVMAQVTLDGTVGPAGPLAAPDYVIADSVGQTLGANLFHSFDTFNIATGESATFTGPAVIDHVISRVTGGNPSDIDGLLRSTIPTADLWFINPAGVMFGENASLDVDGSFHVSTANYVTLGDGRRFDATMPANSTFTSAPPVAFGFLGTNPAALAVNGSSLAVREGESLSLVGGDTTINGAELTALSGRIDMVGAGSAGEVVLNEQGIHTAGMAELADVNITGSTILTVSVAGIPTKGVYILGNALVVEDSKIRDFSNSTGDSGGVRVALTGAMSVNNAEIYTYANDIGKAGDIAITARSLNITDGGKITSINTGQGDGGDVSVVASDAVNISGGGADSGILTTTAVSSGMGGNISVTTPLLSIAVANVSAHTFGAGRSGDVTFDVDRLSVTDGGTVGTDSIGPGAPGNLVITASESAIIAGETTYVSSEGLTFLSGGGGSMHISAPELTVDGSRIAINNSSSGVSGNIEVEVARLQVLNGGTIDASTIFGSGGGSITVSASESVILSGTNSRGYESGILSSSFFTTGPGGAVSIDSPRVTLDQGRISVSSAAGGNAGTVLLNVDHLVLAHGAGVNSYTTFGGGDAGSIVINAAKSVSISGQGGGFISALSSTTTGDGSGDGGMIVVVTPELTMDQGVIESSSSSFGDAGRIDLQLGSLVLENSAQIAATTLGGGSGGTVTIAVGGTVRIFGSGVLALTRGAADAGDINITASELLILGGGKISAESQGSGAAGDILARADLLRLVEDSSISVRTTGGAGGSIGIQADEIEIRSGGAIIADTFGLGDGGALLVDSGSIFLSGDGVPEFTGLSTRANFSSSGDAGDIAVSAESLEVRDGAQIFAGTAGTGAGGGIRIVAGAVKLAGGYISAGSSGSGLAGNIEIDAGARFDSINGSVSTEALSSDGGNITLRASDMIFLVDSSITTSVGSGEGAGGNITIDPEFVILLNSDITANAFGGPGGNITIVAGSYLADPDSIVQASSQLGIAGTVSIEAPESDVSGSLAVLPGNFLDVTALLAQQCGTQGGMERSSLVMGGDRELPPGPGGYLTASTIASAAGVGATALTPGFEFRTACR